MEENKSLNWDTPAIPHKYANVFVMGKSVVLVRHFYADTGNAEKIYRDYIDEKVVEMEEKRYETLVNRAIFWYNRSISKSAVILQGRERSYRNVAESHSESRHICQKKPGGQKQPSKPVPW